jgi:hypothetical protein
MSFVTNATAWRKPKLGQLPLDEDFCTKELLLA